MDALNVFAAIIGWMVIAFVTVILGFCAAVWLFLEISHASWEAYYHVKQRRREKAAAKNRAREAA